LIQSTLGEALALFDFEHNGCVSTTIRKWERFDMFGIDLILEADNDISVLLQALYINLNMVTEHEI
jgi:hypothetical protein